MEVYGKTITGLGPKGHSSKHRNADLYRPASETPLKWRFVSGQIQVRRCRQAGVRSIRYEIQRIVKLNASFRLSPGEIRKFTKRSIKYISIFVKRDPAVQILSLVYMHNSHRGANIHPGCKFAPGV